MKRKLMTFLMVMFVISIVGCGRNKGMNAEIVTKIETNVSENNQEESKLEIKDNFKKDGELPNGVRIELKEGLDNLEQMLNAFLIFMKEYESSGWSSGLDGKYEEYKMKTEECFANFGANYGNNSNMSNEEEKYFNDRIEVILQVVDEIEQLDSKIPANISANKERSDEYSLSSLDSEIAMLLCNMDVYDTVLAYACYGNVSSYVDVNEGELKAVDGNVCGVTITFQPEQLKDGKWGYDISNAVINKFVRTDDAAYINKDTILFTENRAADDVKSFHQIPDYKNHGTLGTMDIDGLNILYERLVEKFGEHIELASDSYHNSEYTIFIEFSYGKISKTLNATSHGEWNGIHLN